MAFRGSPSSFGGLLNSSNDVQVQAGPDLEEIQTEAIGFHAVAGEAKLRLLPSPWPSDSLPPPTASLLSIASKKGLLAAAGPESVIVAGTDSVRQALSAPADGNIKPFTPQLTLPLGMRVSQVAFSADETFLVLSAENGGGLAVYDVQSLMQGNIQTSFEMATNGTALRSLLPNPVEDKAELFAVVSINGELMMANLQTRQFIAGSQGQVLKGGVSSVSWSNRGTQLMAGLGDGTAYQLTPEGQGKGEIARPPALEGDQHISSISWLENEVILVAHTPASSGDGLPSATTYHLITRYPKQSPPSITYQKLPEPVTPFIDRSPSFQFTQRLRKFPPNLDDVIILASTASGDIGLITKSKIPLSDETPTDKLADVFATTKMANDSRRAQLPMSEDLTDTSPIGVGLDLSSKDKVSRPLPAEEYDESPGPLPALMVLNNEGILSAWWFVYAESVRQGTIYPGLVVVGGSQPQQQSQNARQGSPFVSTTSQSAPAPGQSMFGKPSTPAASPFGGALNAASGNSFGNTNTSASTFGAPSTFAKAGTPFGNATASATPAQGGGSTFGQPSFGSSTPLGGANQGTAFGMAGGLGNRSSPWGAPSTGTAAATGSVFGQSGFSASKASPFGVSNASSSNPAPTSGGFSSFASKPSAFMTAAPSGGSDSSFAKPGATTSFGSGMDTDTSFGSTPKKDPEASKGIFGSGEFTLGSTFKGDGSSANDGPKSAGNGSASLFGSNFGNALGDTKEQPATPEVKDDDMGMEADSGPVEKAQPAPAADESTTPAATPAPPKFQFPQVSAPPKTGGLFGTQAQSKTTPAAVSNSQPTGFTFGKPTPLSTTPEDTPQKPDDPRPSIETSPKIKEEPHSDDGGDISPLNEQEAAPPVGYGTPETPPASKTSESPLPPESTSIASFAPGDSSNSSKSSDEAPLPPDFLPSKTKLKEVESAPDATPEEAALPPGDDGEGSGEFSEEGSYDDEGDATDEEGEVLDDEGSGIDVAQEISPTTDPNQSPKITPGSSFGASLDKSPPGTGGLFGRITAPPDRQKSTSLFGEVGKASAPYLPPPTKTQQSPRSPSPVRASLAPRDSLRPDNARSISAPGPFQALNNRKAALSKTTAGSKLQPSPEEARKQAREQMAAERARTKDVEEQNLSDREDERVREELEAEVEGTLTLDPFLAHQDYVGKIDKPGVPGQIETLYRDINSMIDTLGINARSLKAFVKGHEEMHRKNGLRTRDDLEREDWCLIEIGDLSGIEDKLSRKLESGGTQNVQEKLDECRKIRKETATVRAKGADIGRALDSHFDPDEVESARMASLSLEQITQQNDLRRKMTKFQKLLAGTEENITLLRAKLASCDTDNGKGPPMKKPTVEAVTNTIKKMTGIIEKKSIDIEILEHQMRTLRFSSLPSQSSRESSPFNPAHPSPRRKPASRLGASGMQNGHSHTPSRSSILGRSMNGEGTPRKGVASVTPEEVQRYRDKKRRRQEVNAIIKAAFEKDGPRIRTLE